MHVHILGVCGTFMGGVALLARELGHGASGSDEGVYPPMSEQLAGAGIALTEGYDAAQLDDPAIDEVVVGNAMTRGNPCVERLLDERRALVSGPQWLYREVLAGRTVLAVAGTHGKTTTSSMLAWILDRAGLEPGFLIGGVPHNFGVSARLGAGSAFVIEADEYDTAFFDKRSKFVHYRPDVFVVNNLEFDHADIFADVDDVRRQFHHAVRTVPRGGRIVCAADDASIDALLAMGCWSGVERFGEKPNDECAGEKPNEERAGEKPNEERAGEKPNEERSGDKPNDRQPGERPDDERRRQEPAAGHASRNPGDWRRAATSIGRGAGAWRFEAVRADASRFDVEAPDGRRARVEWTLIGRHNAANALAAIAAACAIDVDLDVACDALASFESPRRRLELRADVAGVRVYDDFAHHPTAVRATLEALRASVGGARIVAVLDPASNTMRMGVHRDTLAPSLATADRVLLHRAKGLAFDLDAVAAAAGANASVHDDVDALVTALSAECRAGDHVLVMSNGSFGGIHPKLAAALEAR